jgi:hypothetical protein
MNFRWQPGLLLALMSWQQSQVVPPWVHLQARGNERVDLAPAACGCCWHHWLLDSVEHNCTAVAGNGGKQSAVCSGYSSLVYSQDQPGHDSVVRVYVLQESAALTARHQPTSLLAQQIVLR